MQLDLFLVIMLSTVLGVLLMAYDRNVRELKRIKNEREILEARGRFKAAEIVETAKNRAMEILSKSQIQAGQSQQKIDEELEKIGEMQMENYKDMVQKISYSIEDELKKTLDERFGSAEKVIVQKTEEEFEKARVQIEAYRKARIEQLDRQIVPLAEEASRLLINKVIDFSNHQELVIQALEEAKKDHVL